MAGSPIPELVVFSTSVGAMSNGEEFYRAVLKSRSRRLVPQWVANYMPQKPILDALELLDLRLPMQVISNACSSGTNSIGHAFNLIRDGLNSCVICGGYDPLSELVFVGFDSLQASTPEKIRPFDLHRSGLVLGERGNFRLWSLNRYLPSNPAKSIRHRSEAFHGTCASICWI